jgi:hypothetical protein
MPMREGSQNTGEKKGGHQVERSRYVLDMGGFWFRDKCRIRVVISRLTQCATLLFKYFPKKVSIAL